LAEDSNSSKRLLRKRGLISTGYHIPYNPKLKQRARELRKNMTLAEKRMWLFCLKKLNLNVLRQKPIDHFIVDFYIPCLKLVIEIDGKSHINKQDYDKERTQVLEKYGLKVVRYTNEEVFRNIEGIYDDLMKLAESSPDFSKK